MEYTINLVVDTKVTDIYDKVALNKFPIVIFCDNEGELKEMLSSDDVQNYVKQYIKSPKIFNSAQWYIRSINYEGPVELIWNVRDMFDIFE